MIARIEQVLKEADLLAFLKSRVTGPLKFHHEFRVSLADCPNACSQPQIKHVGIMEKSQRGERFGDILTPSNFDRISARFKNSSAIIAPF